MGDEVCGRGGVSVEGDESGVARITPIDADFAYQRSTAAPLFHGSLRYLRRSPDGAEGLFSRVHFLGA